jgi:hypothetical protein
VPFGTTQFPEAGNRFEAFFRAPALLPVEDFLAAGAAVAGAGAAPGVIADGVAARWVAAPWVVAASVGAGCGLGWLAVWCGARSGQPPELGVTSGPSIQDFSAERAIHMTAPRSPNQRAARISRFTHLTLPPDVPAGALSDIRSVRPGHALRADRCRPPALISAAALHP